MRIHMNSILAILEEHGYDSPDELSSGENITVTTEGMDDLVIEKIRENQISVANTYTQNRDLMRDPEVVFDISGNSWTPKEFTQDPMQNYRSDSSGLDDLDEFLEMWDKNIAAQGYLDNVEID